MLCYAMPSFRSLCRILTVVWLTSAVTAVSMAQPGDPWPQPAPLCPEYPIAFMNGSWYYVTSNCQGTSGYGSSDQFFADSQCNEMGECNNPITFSPVAVKSASGSTLAEWIADVTARRDRLLRIVAHPKTDNRPQGRRARVNRILPFTNQTLAFLHSGASDTEKQAKYDHFIQHFQRHENAWAFVRFAPGSTVPMSLKDKQFLKPDELKSVADTEFRIHAPLPTGASVTYTRGPLLKLDVGAADLIYYQCFHVTEQHGGTTVNLDLGTQVSPTPAEALTAVTGRFGERGAYAHRLLSPAGRPYLVYGAVNLEP